MKRKTRTRDEYLADCAKETAQRDKQMRALRRRGKSLQEIADVFGVSKQRVGQIVGAA